jgi:O-antigen/teichoic acid export membrane protein
LKPIRQLAGQTIIYGAGTIVPRLLNYLLLTPFYTRIFLQGEYGVITELYAYVAFLMVLLTYGMETAYFRYASSESNPDKVYSTALLSLLTTTSLFVLVILFFAQPIASLIRYSANKEYIVYFALIVSIDAFTAIPFARLRQQNKAKRFALIKIINVLVNILMNFFFLLLCPFILSNNPESIVRLVYSPNIGVGYAFISNLIASFITLLLLFPEIFRIRVRVDIAILKKMLAYALPLLIVGLAGMVNDVSDKILLKYLVRIPTGISDPSKYAMEQVGIYGANYRVAVLMTLFIQMFRYAAEPFFFAQAKKDNPQQVYSEVMKYFVISCLIIFMGVMMYMDIVKYFIGSGFRSGLRIVPIVLMANLFLGIFYNLSIWYKLTNRTKYGAGIAMMGAIITIILNVLMVPVFGYDGSAWATLICYLFMMVTCYVMGKKYYPINYNLRSFIGYLTLALVLYFISVIVKINFTFYRLLLNSVLMVIFLGTIYFIEKPKFMRIYR